MAGPIVVELEHRHQVPSRGTKGLYEEGTKGLNEERRKSRRISKSSRVAPAGAMLSNGNATRRKSSRRNKFGLKVDTKAPVPIQNDPSTPATAASTPSSTPGVRKSGDLRSPGAQRTPRGAADGAIPDFITQTDKYGNPVTPRSDGAQGGMPVQDVDIDPCETLLDSIRLMCCCLVPEDAVTPAPAKATKSVAQCPPQAPSSPPPSRQLTFEDKEGVVKLLPPLHPEDKGKKCLVLDLDETLVHSSFRAVPGADFVIPVQIEDVVHFVYVAKRPGVDEFLIEMAKHYEIVIYTASLNKYADPLLDLLDTKKVIRSRLFRESCVYYEGNYVKDLSILDRDLSDSIIIDNSPNSYIFHPENAIDCTSFIDDPNDRELDQIAAFLKGIKDVKDVRGVAPQWRDWPNVRI